VLRERVERVEVVAGVEEMILEREGHSTISLIDSSYSMSSLTGLVSSKRKCRRRRNLARPKFRQIDLAWPMWGSHSALVET
jgi:hypothetical protein